MITAWLSVTAALAGLALIAVWARRPSHYRSMAVCALPLAACVAYGALTVPLGKPTLSIPPGKYDVLGARIDTPTSNNAGAIFVLLDGSQPVYVRLPYSKGAAEALQEAMNGDGDVVGDMSDEGEMQFHEQPVTSGEPKRAERPEFEVE